MCGPSANISHGAANKCTIIPASNAEFILDTGHLQRQVLTIVLPEITMVKWKWAIVGNGKLSADLQIASLKLVMTDFVTKKTTGCSYTIQIYPKL